MSAKNPPKISILVPAYNVEAYLPQCLDSLIGQTLGEIEIILVDDGSTDGSGAIADDYASRDGRIHVIHKPNSGYGDSLNQALERASAPWIAIVEPDDWAEPEMYEHLLGHAEAAAAGNGPVDFVKGSYTRIVTTASGRVERKPGSLDGITPPRQPFSIDECPVLLTAHPSIWTALYRRAFLDEFGIRFLPIPGAGWADNPFFIETMVAARKIAWLDEAVYNYREFEDGTISHLSDWRVIADRWRDMGDVLRKYDACIPAILEGHYVRGCAYLQMLDHDFDQSDPELARAADEMADTLDFEIVRKSHLISKEYKRAYARHLPLEKRFSLLRSWLGLQARAAARNLKRHSQ